MISLLLGIIASSYITMNTIPVPRTTYEPRRAINAAYGYITPQSTISATFKWSAQRPTINLDNFNQILVLECLAQKVVLTFDADESAHQAYTAWINATGLAVIVGHERQCGGTSDVSALAVTSISRHSKRIVILSVVALEYTQVFEGYEVDIDRVSHIVGDTVYPLKSDTSMINDMNVKTQEMNDGIERRKSGRLKDRSGVLTKKSLLNQRIQKIDRFDLNYNRTSGKIIKSDQSFQFGIGIDNTMAYTRVDCINCYMTGNLTTSISIKSKFGSIDWYEVRVDGQVRANADLKVYVQGAQMKTIGYLSLATIPLTPIIIPGVFRFGPAIKLDTYIDVRVVDTIQMEFGYDYTHKFSFYAQGDGILRKPLSRYTGKPELNIHRVELGSDVPLKVVAHLVPYITLGLEIFKSKVGISVGLENQVAVKVSGGGSSSCLKGRMDMAVIQKHDVGFWITTLKHMYAFGLYSTGDQNLVCAFCNRCF